MPHIGPTEIIVILLIVVLLFGVGRIGKIGGELGRGIKEFRKAVQDDEAKKETNQQLPAAAATTETKPDETKTSA